MGDRTPHAATPAGTFEASTREGIGALRIGVAGLAATVAFQTVVVFLTGSVALLGDTLHNGVDVAGSASVWLAFRIARRGRSDRFSFGYHRFEDLAGLVVGLLIAASALVVVYEAVRAFRDDLDVDRPWAVLAAGLIGFAGNEAVAIYKIRAGRRIGSLALEADGRHSRADGLTSLGVVAAGLGLIAGLDWLDAAVGLAVAGFIGWIAFVTGKGALVRLLDGSDPRLAAVLLGEARHVQSLEHVNDVRIRHSGRTVHVVASVCMEASSPLSSAHEAAEALRERWLRLLPPGSAVDIHVDPFTPGAGHEALHHAGTPVA